MGDDPSDKSDEDLTYLQAEFCKGMAHPKRIQIIRALRKGERSVNDLGRATGIPQANLSQHLSLLRQNGLLRTRREGTTIYYSISDQRIEDACELVRQCIGERLRGSQLVLAESR